MADTMKSIESLLDDNKINVDGLPQKLVKAIENAKKHHADWEQAKGELTEESSEEEVLEVQELAEVVNDYNENILEAIQKFLEANKNPDPDPAPDPAPIPTPKPKEDPTPHVAPKEEKKGNGVGWAIFGAIALVVTLGAVNVMKK
jgi:hypothetical protein